MRKKPILFVVVPLALIVALVALAPTLLSGYARGRVERELGARLQGSIASPSILCGLNHPSESPPSATEPCSRAPSSRSMRPRA